MNFARETLISMAQYAAAFLPKLLLAIITLIIGWWLINKLSSYLYRLMEKRNVDPSLRPFLRTVLNIGMKILLIISVASMIGIKTSSFVAVIGAAGLAIGLALQGSLSNFAGGVLILLLRPFRVGDFITAQGESGTVHEIQIFYTILKTPENITVIIPNGKLSNDIVTNFSIESTRRLELKFGISYNNDIGKAKSIIREIVKNDDRVLKNPEPQIIVTDLGDNAVIITVRCWTERPVFWDTNFALRERVKLRFDEENITIPFPQREIHVYNH